MKQNNRAFTLVEVLLVMMVLSAGILPIYSLISSGQRNVARSDSRILGTLYGTSAIELARSLGYERAQRLGNDEDFLTLCANAEKNGFQMSIVERQNEHIPLDKEGKHYIPVLKIVIEVLPIQKGAGNKIARPRFLTVLTGEWR